MNSPLKAISHVPSQLSSPLELVTSWGNVRSRSPSALMQYDDGRSAQHPRFRFFALNTEMRHRALQTGRVYVCQHPGDAQLSLDELHHTWWEGKERLSPLGCFTMRPAYVAPSSTDNANAVASSPWLIHWVCLPSSSHTVTIFFTNSAADLQWPELARLICPDNPDSKTAHAKAVIENPALADWFFYHRVIEFVKAFYIGLQAKV